MCEFPIRIFIEGFEPYLMVAGVGGLSYYLCICKIDLPQAQIITEQSIWGDLLISDFGMKAFQRREKIWDGESGRQFKANGLTMERITDVQCC